jgi:hypothetical protein
MGEFFGIEILEAVAFGKRFDDVGEVAGGFAAGEAVYCLLILR